MYSDILRSKRTLGWRTLLIVPELEHEVSQLTLSLALTLTRGLLLVPELSTRSRS